MEARAYILMYASAFAAGCIAPASVGAGLINYWVIPSVMGQPFLRFYLFAEHRGCSADPTSVLDNTRTMRTNWLYRKLAWNMPYHMEHHCEKPCRTPDMHIHTHITGNTTMRSHAEHHIHYIYIYIYTFTHTHHCEKPCRTPHIILYIYIHTRSYGASTRMTCPTSRQ